MVGRKKKGTKVTNPFGRPKVPKEQKRVTLIVTVDPKVYARVDEVAKKLSLTRSKVVDNLLTVALMDYDIYDKIGLIDAAQLLRKFADRLGVTFDKVKESLQK